MTATLPAIGETLPAIDKTFTTVDLMAYGAATWDWYRVHYDGDKARSLNFPAVFVDGQQYGAMFARQVIDHFGPSAFLSSMTMRYHSMAFAGDRVTGAASIVASDLSDDGKTVIFTVDHRLDKDGALVASARSMVRLIENTCA